MIKSEKEETRSEILFLLQLFGMPDFQKWQRAIKTRRGSGEYGNI